MTIARRGVLAASSLLLPDIALARPQDDPFRALEHRIGGKIGVHAFNALTGAQLSWRADERFTMCSTFKALAVGALLVRVDQRHETLDAVVRYRRSDLIAHAPITEAHLAEGLPLRALCEAAVTVSDNTAANLVLARIGGPKGLTAWLRGIGDGVTRLDHNEPALNHPSPAGLDSTTPAAMAATLQKLVLGNVLSPSSRALLIQWMVDCKTGLKRLRAGVPKDWRVADKTGTGYGGAAGDNAVIWPNDKTAIVVSAYTTGSRAAPDKLESIFPEIGKLVAQRLVT